MAKQPGRTYLIKIGDGESSEAFSTLCGLTTKGLTINNNFYDNTTAACGAEAGALWRSARTGIKSISFSGDGLLEDEDAEKRLIAVAMAADAVANFQVIVPGLGTFAGAFGVEANEIGAEMEGDINYAISMTSVGAPTFTEES
ncbi:MAG: phage major tail protein, TP901-1 family [Rhodobacteraceae bacterium]|nr:MAG: phage major tail protein, TP901-1 family [Paracoccaceae bacterium]